MFVMQMNHLLKVVTFESYPLSSKCMGNAERSLAPLPLSRYLESKGDCRVLVVDGGGSMKCALLGGNLGQLAQNNGWAGIVVNGCIRDVNEINVCDIGVRALAAHPKKSKKRGAGERHIPIHIAGIEIHDGVWLYADSDGIIISKTELSV